jgi:hypothetical protein
MSWGSRSSNCGTGGGRVRDDGCGDGSGGRCGKERAAAGVIPFRNVRFLHVPNQSLIH